MDNRPYLRVYTVRKDKKKFLCVAQQLGIGHIKILKSFGSASKEENWDKAIGFVMEQVELWYLQQKKEHFELMRK
jgi:hypothetical protein